MIITLIVFRAGVVEELFYRGYAIERLQMIGLGRFWSVTIPLVIFSLGHRSGGGANILIALAAGTILTAFYLWRRDLVANMIGHGLVDFVANVLPKFVFLRPVDCDSSRATSRDDAGRLMKRLIVFAPGAGAPCSHPWMQQWKHLLSEIGDVETFDYDYMCEGRKRPDPLPQLIATHRKALQMARERHQPDLTLLIGKSMGGRVGCHVSLEEKVNGVICLGYPLCAMGDRTKLRDEILRALNTPILFVQGMRDSLCPLDLLERIRAEMKAPNLLHTVEGGDHSLRVPKRQLQATSKTQEDIDQQILKTIAGFVDRLVTIAG